jgi:hypothetical protein
MIQIPGNLVIELSIASLRATATPAGHRTDEFWAASQSSPRSAKENRAGRHGP